MTYIGTLLGLRRTVAGQGDLGGPVRVWADAAEHPRLDADGRAHSGLEGGSVAEGVLGVSSMYRICKRSGQPGGGLPGDAQGETGVSGSWTEGRGRGELDLP